ncbi:MAG: FAD-binding protein, partial [Rhizobiaceae bacterium]
MTLFRPTDERDLAGFVREAAALGEPMAICGGGTKHGIGAPVAAPRRVSLTGLSGVVAYEPAEMVATFRAGTRLADVEALLAGKGQRLAFEPPDFRALLGADGEPTIGA